MHARRMGWTPAVRQSPSPPCSSSAASRPFDSTASRWAERVREMDGCGPLTLGCHVGPGLRPFAGRLPVSELAIRRGAAPALAVDGLSYAYPRAPRRALDAVSL